MSYLKSLDAEEIGYICSVIPHVDIIRYFKKNPKEFSKIRPGFRPEAIRPKDAVRLIVANINKDFISSFVEKTVSRWLNQIQEAYQSHVDEGENDILALVYTLSQSYFSDNVSLYFKLSNRKFEEKDVVLVSDLIQEQRKNNKEIISLNENINELKEYIKKLETSEEKKAIELKKTKSKLLQLTNELEAVRIVLLERDALAVSLESAEEKIEKLENQERRLREKIRQLVLEIEAINDEKERLESDIVSRLQDEQKRAVELKERKFSLLHPADMLEFSENLSYTFEDIGISNSAPGILLLKKYLAKVLFCGLPIIMNEKSGLSIAKCVANALIGTQEVSVLKFTEGILEKDIWEFMSESKRVIVLENFIGNYNETLLIPLFKMFGDKIIFITTVYDKILNYVSDEFFKYCTYINVDQIEQLLINVEIKEDPLTTPEEEYSLLPRETESRPFKALHKILTELRLDQLKANIRIHDSFDDDSVSAELIYSILPYCIYVCNKAPMYLSESLQKYTLRSPYKELITEWFANE